MPTTGASSGRPWRETHVPLGRSHVHERSRLQSRAPQNKTTPSNLTSDFWPLRAPIDTIHRPGRNSAFIGTGTDPTQEWVYTVNGRAWIKHGGVGKETRLIARHTSHLRALRDPKNRMVILTAGTDRSLTHLSRHAYLIRYDERHGKLRHFKIGDATVVHTDLAIHSSGRIVSLFTNEKDGTLYMHNLKPGQY